MASHLYHRKTAFNLGYPINPLTPDDDKSKSTVFEIVNKTTLVNDIAGAEIEFVVDYAEDRKKLYKLLKFDLSLEAKFTFSVRSEIGFEKQIDFTSTSLVYVVYASKMYNKERIEGTVQLSETGKERWKSACETDNILEFQRAVGSEIITEVSRGNTIALIYKFSCSTTKQRDDVYAKLNLKWASGKLNMDFKSELSEIDDNLRIEIYGFQSGVSELTPLGARLANVIASTPGDLPTINVIVKEILNNVNPADRKASPLLEVTTMMVKDLKEISENPIKEYSKKYNAGMQLNNIIDESIIELSGYMIRNNKQIEELTEYKNYWNEVDFIAGSKKLIEDKLKELRKNKAEIFKAYNKCINATDVDETLFDVTDIEPLAISKIISTPYIIPLSWQEKLDQPPCNPANEETFVTSHFYPVVQIKFPKIIDYIFILQNDAPVRKINCDEIYQIVKQNGSFAEIWDNPITNQKNTWGCKPSLTVPAQKELIILNRTLEGRNKYAMEIFPRQGKSHKIDIGNIVNPILRDGQPYAFLSEAEIKKLDKYIDKREFALL